MKLPVDKIKPNKDNPRTIRDDKFKKLVQSIKDFPEMADIRPVVLNKDYVILGGNMRFKAMKEAGWTEIPVKIVDLTEEQQKEFIIKDNVSGGDWNWEELHMNWNTDILSEWGLELFEAETADDFDDEFTNSAEPRNVVVIELDKYDYKEMKEDLNNLLSTVKHKIKEL